MLERRSALASASPYNSSSLRIQESPDFTLTQVSGLTPDFEKKFKTVIGSLPDRVGIASTCDGRTILRTGPSHVWIIASEVEDYTAAGAVTPLSGSRTRILVDGPPSRDVLAKGIPLDLHISVFKPGHFAMSGLHHTPVLVHCIGEHTFHVYALRTFALSVWDWLLDAAQEYR